MNFWDKVNEGIEGRKQESIKDILKNMFMILFWAVLVMFIVILSVSLINKTNFYASFGAGIGGIATILLLTVLFYYLPRILIRLWKKWKNK